MKIAISSGHGKYIRGASGNPVPPQLDEVDEARRVVERVADYLGEANVEVETFHDNTSHDQSTNLDTIVDWHNDQDRDLDISVHFNCYDGSAHGVEVLWTSDSGKAIAAPLSEAISLAGNFTNRGAKERNDLAFLNGTDETSVLIETCFCDHTGDSNNYNARFENICRVIAENLVGHAIGEHPPERPPVEPPAERPPVPPSGPGWRPPENIPVWERPVLSQGDEGIHVTDLQRMLLGPTRFGLDNVDGDFGPYTKDEVEEYQVSRGLTVDGVVGEETWKALYANKPALPPPAPPPHALSKKDQEAIISIANNSAISNYYWEDRGVAPDGYTRGMALAFAQTYLKLKAGHPAAVQMARAERDTDYDALHVYHDEFQELGMDNDVAGPGVLRHLYTLMLGHGMRESNGRHCCGRDQNAENVQSDTCEAGIFQTSYNANAFSEPYFDDLMDEYSDPANEATCYYEVFTTDVECDEDDWDCYGSGVGYEFQKLCKDCPPFSVETAALTLRNRCDHYGPIKRLEVELVADAANLFIAVQDYMDEQEEIA